MTTTESPTNATMHVSCPRCGKEADYFILVMARTRLQCSHCNYSESTDKGRDET